MSSGKRNAIVYFQDGSVEIRDIERLEIDKDGNLMVTGTEEGSATPCLRAIFKTFYGAVMKEARTS